MPRITPQQSTGREVVKRNGVKTSSILDGVVEIAELPRAPMKVLIYGQNRVGKTTLACQGEKPLLLISYEPSPTGGAESVRKIPGVNYLKISSVQESIQLVKELREGGLKRYKTMVLDSVTSFQDLVLMDICGWHDMPEQLGFGMVSGDQYRDRAEKTKGFLRHYKDLPIDTFFIAKEKDHNPPKEEKVNPRTGKIQPDMRPKFLRGVQDTSWITAELGGATAGWLQDACDWVCRLYIGNEIVEKEMKIQGKTVKTEVDTGKFTHYLRTGYHPNYAAGCRSGDPVPEEIQANTPAEMYTKLIKLVRGE